MTEIADREAILDAFLALLAEREVDRIALADIADRAGVTLADLAAASSGKLALLDAFARRVDGEVLRLDASDVASEAPRERLFDVLMSRIDALRPHRLAVRSLMRSVRRDPGLALALNARAVRSHAFMLAAAGIDAGGWRGRVVAQGMALLFARVLAVFVREEDAGLPRTMAALDRELREAERRYLRAARFTGPWVRDRASRMQAEAPGVATVEPAVPPAEPAAGPVAAGEDAIAANLPNEWQEEPAKTSVVPFADPAREPGVELPAFTDAPVKVAPEAPEQPREEGGAEQPR